MENCNLAGAPLELYRPSRHPNSMPQQCSTRHFCANLFVHGDLGASGFFFCSQAATDLEDSGSP